LLIKPGDRLALVGPNGTGKSTALRLLAGDLQADTGDVRILGRQTVAYLRQSRSSRARAICWTRCSSPSPTSRRCTRSWWRSRREWRDGTTKRTSLATASCRSATSARAGYELESRVRRLTADVGFTEADLGRTSRRCRAASAGRLELAKVLVRQPDLLLLDEPTNHLDLAAIERLEAFLAEYPGAFVMVSHDRAFIRAVCREIVELENGKFVRYPMGWDKYVVERDARIELAARAYERQKEHVDKTEDFIRRNLAGQKTKQAQSRRKMLEKIERLERPDDHWEHAGKIALSFQTGGDLAARRRSARPSSTSVTRRPRASSRRSCATSRPTSIGATRWASWGPNGGGKSTLLRTLIGELPPLAGKVEIGTGVRIGYFDQKLGTLDESLTLEGEIRSVRADLSPEAVRNYLAKFRFFGDDPFKVVRGLSGGERSRLAMAKIMLFPRNVLVLDEPTNHLDIPARETLEEALDGYEGTLIVISHDRYFLDRVCTRLLVIEGDHVEAHLGNYSDWRHRAHEAQKKEVAAAPPPPKAPASDAAKDRTASKERERELRRLEKRVETLEADVGKLEADLAAVRAELAGDHAGDWQSCTSWPTASGSSTRCSPAA
jgi:ATP-binding cassette subfamily F protein 3